MKSMIEKERIIEAIYRTLLLRDPDENGWKVWSEFLLAGGTVEDFLRYTLTSPEFLGNFQAFQRHYKTGEHLRFIFDHSQNGEVGKLIKLMAERSAGHRFIVDAGARGRDRSNSHDLLTHWGWRGILIEANPVLIPTIREEFAGLNVEIVHAAVSDREGTATLHVGINDDVSSITEAAAKAWGDTRGAHVVPMRRLGSILDEQQAPPDFDVLSLDIEGEDCRVLSDLVDNTGYRPKWVIIEASYEFATKTLHDIPLSPLTREVYEICDQTYVNLILRRKC